MAREHAQWITIVEETVRFVRIELSISISEIYIDMDIPPLGSWLDAD